MKRAFTALTLFSALALSPHFAEAQEFGSGDGGSDNSSSISPSDFLDQADGCPYTAMAMYQQRMIYQQQQTIWQLQQASRSADGGPKSNSTTGTSSSVSKSVVANGNKKTKKKKPTLIASKSAKSKKATAKLATADETRAANGWDAHGTAHP